MHMYGIVKNTQFTVYVPWKSDHIRVECILVKYYLPVDHSTCDCPNPHGYDPSAVARVVVENTPQNTNEKEKEGQYNSLPHIISLLNFSD